MSVQQLFIGVNNVRRMQVQCKRVPEFRSCYLKSTLFFVLSLEQGSDNKPWYEDLRVQLVLYASSGSVR